MKFLFRAVAESQPRELIYVIKKETHPGSTLEKRKETPDPAGQAQPTDTVAPRPPRARTFRGGAFSGVHRVWGKS